MSSSVLRNICLATDFSDASAAALSTAAGLARTYEARIDLLFVVAPRPFYARIVAPWSAAGEDAAAIDTQVRDRLTSVASQPPLAGLSVDSVVRSGVPFAEIVDHARECSSDLIVVGASAKRGLQGLVLGRTAERVVRKADVPVLVAKRALAPRPEVVLTATDFSPASVPAVRQAASLARQWGARLVIAHIIEPAAEVYGWGAELAGGEVYLVEPEALDPEWQALLAEVELANVRWSQVTRRGYAVQTLCELAGDERADLVVLGTHGRSAIPHVLLGSVAEGVVRACESCVLTVRPDALPFELR